MADPQESSLINQVSQVAVPGLGCDLGAAGAEFEQSADGLLVKLGFPHAGISAELEASVAAAAGTKTVLQTEIVRHSAQGGMATLPAIKNVIAVASGKGGVGKSALSVNLALALAKEGAEVGLLDADIYGPSQPTMLGLEGQQPVSRDGKTFDPLEAWGLQVMSVGFLVQREQALIWRGPMVTQALQQLMFQTQWRELDYLVVDLPPGTGDIQLTLTQKIPVSGAVVVTTPQDIALLDARRAVAMFEKVSLPVLGIIENMSGHTCSQCGHVEPLFGEGGGAGLADEAGLPLLGQIPLDLRIRAALDEGRPTVGQDPESELSLAYRAAARSVAWRLALRPRDYQAAFGTISVEST